MKHIHYISCILPKNTNTISQQLMLLHSLDGDTIAFDPVAMNLNINLKTYYCIKLSGNVPTCMNTQRMYHNVCTVL